MSPRFFCPLLMSLLFFLAVLIVGGPSADAQGGPPVTGSWGTPQTTVSGSFDYSDVLSGKAYNVTGQPWYSYYPGQLLWVYSDPTSPSHVDSSGTYTVTRTWSGPPGTAPKTVSILETSSATGSGGIYGLIPGTGTAQDAFHDPPVPFSGGVTSQGGRLIQVDSSSGVITLSGTTSASGDTPAHDLSSVSGNTAVYSGVNSSFSWNFDPRTVAITCPSIEDAYYKGASARNGSDRFLDLRNAVTGAITTDSAVSPPLTQPGGGTTWTASPTLLAQVPGFQSPIFAWSDSGAGSLTTVGNSAHTILSVSFPLSSTNNVLGQQSVVTLKATDGDGATGTNTFAIRWHYPYENWQTQGSSFENAPIAFPSSDGPQVSGGQVHIPVTSAGIQWDVAGKIGGGLLSLGTTGIGILAPETDPIIIGFMNSAGYGLSVINSPPPPTIYTEPGTQPQFQQDVGTELSIISGNTSGVFLPARPRMDPTLAVNANHSGNYASYFGGSLGTLTFNVTAYKRQWQQNYMGDNYGQNGYIGPAAASVNWDGEWKYVWNWVWTPIANPPAH